VVVVGGGVENVVLETPVGGVWVKAARAVILASGGFTHNRRLRDNYLGGSTFGECAARTHEGDVVTIAEALRAAMGSVERAGPARGDFGRRP
jgi:hypothetical protein